VRGVTVGLAPVRVELHEEIPRALGQSGVLFAIRDLRVPLSEPFLLERETLLCNRLDPLAVGVVARGLDRDRDGQGVRLGLRDVALPFRSGGAA
jgi:hypothetical protein